MSDKSFVDSAMSDCFIRTPSGYRGSDRNTYNGEDCAPFSEFKRTPSPNAVPEVTYDKKISDGKPSGESDQF